MSQNGKGSKARPYSVKYSTYCENWDNIFRKNENKEKQNDKGTNKKRNKKS